MDAATVLPGNRKAQDPDIGLMLRVQRDEAGAFAELVERFSPLVFGRFFRQLGDRQEAEDLVQEVFLRVYRHRKRYLPTVRFATWLFHITQNAARNALRSRRRHPCVHVSLLTGADVEGTSGSFLTRQEQSPSRPMERRELAEMVRAAVSDLAGRQRTALELHQFQELTYAEVARELDMSPKAAKSLLYRARNQLRLHLTRLMEGPD